MDPESMGPRQTGIQDAERDEVAQGRDQGQDSIGFAQVYKNKLFD